MGLGTREETVLRRRDLLPAKGQREAGGAQAGACSQGWDVRGDSAVLVAGEAGGQVEGKTGKAFEYLLFHLLNDYRLHCRAIHPTRWRRRKRWSIPQEKESSRACCRLLCSVFNVSSV